MTRKANARLLSRLVLTCLLGACLISGTSGAGPGRAQGEVLRVVVSVPPQQTFVKRVGGRYVEVRAMVRPGYSPHTYDPTPHQITALSDADLYIRTGVPFEHAWMERIRSANREMRILDARSGIGLDDLEVHEQGRGQGKSAAAGDHRHEHHHRTGEDDPHVWTDPILVKRMAGKIRDKLIELDPENTQDFEHNYEGFAAELEALDQDIRTLLEPVSKRKFMVFHPAWGYFARAYGLTQVPIEQAGKEPGPRALTALIEQARREEIKVIFVQPQFSAKSAAQVARAISGQVLAIDPLAADYVANLREVARQIAGTMRK